MEITTTCPLCKTPMRWLLHDDRDVYTCNDISKQHECPIDFEEEIQYPDGVYTSNMTDGTLLSFSFCLDDYHIMVESSKQTSQIWREDVPCTDSPVFIVSSFEDPPLELAGSSKPKGRRKWFPVCRIPYTFEIDWHHLDNFKERLKTWIIFS
jgi:hypothetical protein